MCLLACLMAGCSTVNQPQGGQTETAACRVPGHFCQTFFGP